MILYFNYLSCMTVTSATNIFTIAMVRLFSVMAKRENQKVQIIICILPSEKKIFISMSQL